MACCGRSRRKLKKIILPPKPKSLPDQKKKKPKTSNLNKVSFKTFKKSTK